MATVSTGVKRAFVRFISRSSIRTSTSFLETLQAFSDARIKQAGNGKVLISTKANLHEDQFQIPDSFNTTDAIEMAETIESRYEEAVAFLVKTIPTPTDAQIVAEIMDKLHRVATIAHDFRRIRLIQPFDTE